MLEAEESLLLDRLRLGEGFDPLHAHEELTILLGISKTPHLLGVEWRLENRHLSPIGELHAELINRHDGLFHHANTNISAPLRQVHPRPVVEQLRNDLPLGLVPLELNNDQIPSPL